MRWLLLVMALGACASERPVETAQEPMVDTPLAQVQAPVVPKLPAAPTGKQAAATKPWTFAVLSDLHLPNYHTKRVDHVVAALVAMKVRLVIVTGDHTNGDVKDGRHMLAKEWWDAVTGALRPLQKAGIAVLPVAGNHDAYLPWQRDAYRKAFMDLDKWAAPFTINARIGRGHAQPPFSYSVDVDGVHFTLAHVVAQSLEPEVAEWIADDLAASRRSTHRLVFGHVPMTSIIRPPNERFVKQFAPILERGKADFYVAGHEHVFWDETFALPAGAFYRQVLVGCASGYYNYGPWPDSKGRAGCYFPDPKNIWKMKCTMPNGGMFDLVKGRKDRQGRDRLVQHETLIFSVFTVDGGEITVTPMSVDAAGRPRAFYLPD